jgi:methionyl-tRNA synthetase
MSDSQRKILVTSALPYANGSPHMGHLVEYIQTDIWVRFQKLRGHDCIYVCASDSHGTPIMLKARELGITPEELTEGYSKEFVSDFADFGIEFDNYHTTHSPENEEIVGRMYQALRERGDIYTRTIEQSKTSTAMPVRCAARPTPLRTLSIPSLCCLVQLRSSASRNIIFSSSVNTRSGCAIG